MAFPPPADGARPLVVAEDIMGEIEVFCVKQLMSVYARSDVETFACLSSVGVGDWTKGELTGTARKGAPVRKVRQWGIALSRIESEG